MSDRPLDLAPRADIAGVANSKGAHLELHIAHRLGLEIGTVDEFAA